MSKKIYISAVLILIISVIFMSKNSKHVDTFSLVDKSDYAVFVEDWFNEYEKFNPDVLSQDIGKDISNLDFEYDRLRTFYKFLEAYDFEESLIPEEYKVFHTKLKPLVISALYDTEQIMQGLVQSNSKLIETGKTSLFKTVLLINKIKEEFENINNKS